MSHEKDIAKEMITCFAPAERAGSELIERQIQKISHSEIVSELLQSFNGISVIINSDRQIIAANLDTIRKMNLINLIDEAPFSKRLGEALGCKFSCDLPGGCGTTRHCIQCGNMKTILACLESGKPETGECLLRKFSDGQETSVEFSVLATPMTIEDLKTVLVCMRDISDEKRRAAMEKIFYHDILNNLGALQGWSELMSHVPAEEMIPTANKIYKISNRVVNDVRFQQALLHAEKGELECDFELISIIKLFNYFKDVFDKHECARDRHLEISFIANAAAVIKSDRRLLERVVGNMLKNAFEATEPGGTVVLSYEKFPSGCAISVKNDGVIPDSVAVQIFKRSFSTKSRQGRGLGTYSMKMFGENYLKGHVYFVSDKVRGTVFTIDLPEDPETVEGA